MRACVDCLPSYRNLRRWGKVLSDKCALCNEGETMRHALTGCNTAVNQGRFDLRHDSILLHIVKQMRESKQHTEKRIIADVPGFRLPDGGTVPPELLVTNLRPDIVLIEEKTNAVELFELTSCADSRDNITNAQDRKQRRYRNLKTDLNAKLQCFEVCALGNIPSHARNTIRYQVGKKAARDTFKKLAKLAFLPRITFSIDDEIQSGTHHLYLRERLWISVRSSRPSLHGAQPLSSLWLFCSGVSLPFLVLIFYHVLY